MTGKQTGKSYSYSGKKIELFHNHTHCPKNLFAFPTLPASDRTNVIYKYFLPFYLRLFEYRNLSVSNLKENVKITVIPVVSVVPIR